MLTERNGSPNHIVLKPGFYIIVSENHVLLHRMIVEFTLVI